jgi:hypothetical protein
MIVYQLLVQSVAASYFMNAWNLDDCQGPPSVYYQFLAIRVDLFPPVATYYASQLSFNKCGSSITPYVNPMQCCVSSLESDKSPYRSASYFIAADDLEDNIPQKANGQRLCQVASNRLGNSSVLAGLSLIGIAEGSNFMKISCETGGVLRIDPYSFDMDSNRTERYILTPTATPINSPFYGSISAKF